MYNQITISLAANINPKSVGTFDLYSSILV